MGCYCLRNVLALGLGMAPIILGGTIQFGVTDLASNATDPALVNAWGIAASTTSPFWIGANGSGFALLYNGSGVKQALAVSIPGDGSVTGVAFNANNAGGAFHGDLFLFDSEDGTVSGWRSTLGTTAETLLTGSDANVYKGIAEAQVNGSDYAYLANFRAGTVDVVKGETTAPNLTGNFTDPSLPTGYAPFDIQDIGGVLYITYAVQDSMKHDDVAGAGNGIVDRFDTSGNFLGRLITGGDLNSPWGMAIAPAGFGGIGGDLLVGNFGDGTIHAYNPVSGAFVETLTGPDGNPLTIDGLWSLEFGNNGMAGSANTLFFTAGPNDEMDGLFGEINPTPEPAVWISMALGLGLMLVGYRHRSRRRAGIIGQHIPFPK